jgi:hypothetical protein
VITPLPSSNIQQTVLLVEAMMLPPAAECGTVAEDRKYGG